MLHSLEIEQELEKIGLLLTIDNVHARGFRVPGIEHLVYTKTTRHKRSDPLGPMATQPASTFLVATPDGERPVLEVAKRAGYHHEFIDDLEKCEYFVPVKWLQTVPVKEAIQEIGLFGNQNTICKPTTPKWRSTVERLKARFENYDK